MAALSVGAHQRPSLDGIKYPCLEQFWPGFLTSSCSLERACANLKNNWADGGSVRGSFKGRDGLFPEWICLEMKLYCFLAERSFFLSRLSVFVGFWGVFASSVLKVDCSTFRAWRMKIFGM